MNAVNIAEYSQALGLQARTASGAMARADAMQRNTCLRTLAALLRDGQPALQAANALDLDRASTAGLSAPMVDRLKLTPKCWRPAPRAASSWPRCPT
jgi:glutamate-5-semialdehyde dehydrogenase